MTNALVLVGKNPAKYAALEKQYPLVVETLGLVLRSRHSIKLQDGIPYPVQNTGFPKGNWAGREKELTGYAKALCELEPALRWHLVNRTTHTLDKLLLRQSLRTTSFKENDVDALPDLTEETALCEVEPIDTNLKSPFSNKLRSNSMTRAVTSIEQNFFGDAVSYDQMHELDGISKGDLLFRLVAYTADEMGLASEDRLVKIATVALFEQLAENAWAAVLQTEMSSTITNETNLAMTTLNLIPQALSIPGLGINDKDLLIKDYSRVVHDVTKELFDKSFDICTTILTSNSKQKGNKGT